MNSQQELLDAISTLNKNKDRSYDTPATVLRVDGDTVWVHIDGGADETPVARTINCEQGETVQVRISNGSAFLVGNASAPPTDDKRANAAHFIAQEAAVEATAANVTAVAARDVAVQAQAAVAQSLTVYETWYILSATEPTQPTEDSHTGWSTTEPAWSSSSTDTLYYSIRTVKGDGSITWSAVGTVQSYADLVILKNAVISTVASDYVGQGSSGVTSLSSTMYQNVNGVNIYNNTLATGDSYTHIDGDSLDIKTATTAGSIDDTNDPVVASFGKTEISMKSPGAYVGEENYVNISSNGIQLGTKDNDAPYDDSGWEINNTRLGTYSSIYGINHIEMNALLGKIMLQQGNSVMNPGYTEVGISSAKFWEDGSNSNFNEAYTNINGSEITCFKEYGQLGQTEPRTIIKEDSILMTGDVYDYDAGYKKTPTVLTSTTISASTTSYTFSNAAITTNSVLDLYDTIFGFSPTNMTVSNGSCTVTFPAQSSSHTMKLFIY